ncbi:MAG: hypothetical protein RJB38_82 [Pseudomonadota bacterium]|jgi:hypothetical protein
MRIIIRFPHLWQGLTKRHMPVAIGLILTEACSLGWGSSAWLVQAQEKAAPRVVGSIAPKPIQPVGSNEASSPQRKKSQREWKSSRDAEGTAAPDRFEAETVIKSQYLLDGKTLEVDPD